MRLAAFIRENSRQIIREWEDFARTLVPAADGISPLALRNHIHPILACIADDIDSAHDEAERIMESRDGRPNSKIESMGRIHAALHQSGGFELDQMVSEYRALRASVTRLWAASEPAPERVTDLIRFNEAIDRALTESASHSSKRINHSLGLILGSLSHDLRNPIAVMLMAAQLAQKIGPLSERQNGLISQVISSAGRATDILDQLLDLTRTRLGSGLRVIREPMDMASADLASVGRQMPEEILHPDRPLM